MILMVDHEKNVLQTKATAGFEGELRELVETAEFHIDPENTHGFFIRVLNNRKPLFLGDAQRKMDQLSVRSQRFLKLLGTKAFIAVPIIATGQAAGVIAVENTSESRPLVNDDMDLLLEVAKFMGLIVPNIKNFQAIQKSEKLAKALEEQERQLRTIFQKFVPEEAVSRLSHFGSEFLSVQKRIVDVMFVDIIGFTTISEKCHPEEVADILNIYIDEVQRTVNRFKGRINKIIGDGLLIYFDNLGPHSILAGHAILQACSIINSRLAAKGYLSISIGVGAHRGVCTLGLIGTTERLDYTLIGDTVNVAARIESYTRQIGPNTFCFSSTLLPEAKKFRHVSKGKVFLKGRKKSIGIFQLLKPLRTPKKRRNSNSVSSRNSKQIPKLKLASNL
jgi:adenylate cyclase